MKRLIILFMTVFAVSSVHAAFEAIGGTARSKAFGGAIFGDMDGVNSVGYNPATISMVRNVEIYGAWDTPYTGFNDGSGINSINIDAVMPFWNAVSFDPYFSRRAAIGISVHRTSTVVNGSEIYHEGVYSFAYGKDLNDVISRGAKISAGVRFNLFDIGYGTHPDITANPDLAGISLSKMGFGLDVGLTYDFSETIRLGLAYKNLISPNMAILSGGTVTLPSELRFGGNWNIGQILFMKNAKVGFGIVRFSRDATDNRAPDMSYNAGYEFSFISAENFKSKPFKGELFSVRFGAVYQPVKTSDSVINISGGFGFRWVFAHMHEIRIDYAIEYGFTSSMIQHTAGLTYSLLLPRSAFSYKKRESKEVKKDVAKELDKAQAVDLTKKADTKTVKKTKKKSKKTKKKKRR